MAQFRNTTNALRPHTSCAQIIPYQSHEIKINKKARKIFNGMMPDILRGTQCRNAGGSNAWIPLGSDSQYNQALHFWAASRWPMVLGSNQNVNDYANAPDPMLYDVDKADSNSANQHARTSGWDWEIGSISLHDRYSGPGGIRPERCVYPPALTLFMTDPNGVRPKGNVPYKEMLKAWNFGYFNQSRHFFTKARTWESIPVDDVFKNRFSHSLSYYGSNSSGYALKPEDHLPLFARPNQSSSIARNADGHRPYNGDAVDFMHAYSMSGWGALINNSPLHLISHKHYVISNILAWFGGGMSANPSVLSRFHSRQDAWHWLAMTMAWKLSSNHPLGIPRSVVETRMQYYLDAIHNSVYIPSLTSEAIEFQCIRAFGTPGDDSVDGTTHVVRSWNGSMAFYMAGVFHLMKTTGVWDMLWNKSEQNRTTMKFWVECYDKYSLDFVLDTDIRYDYYMPLTVPVPVGEPNAPLPTSWADWAVKVKPKTGVEDWVTNADGSHRNERDGNTHLRAQYAFMRRDFDLYVPNPKIIPACNKYQGYYDLMEQRVNARVGAYDKRNLDWNVRWPGNGILKPSEV